MVFLLSTCRYKDGCTIKGCRIAALRWIQEMWVSLHTYRFYLVTDLQSSAELLLATKQRETPQPTEKDFSPSGPRRPGPLARRKLKRRSLGPRPVSPPDTRGQLHRVPAAPAYASRPGRGLALLPRPLQRSKAAWPSSTGGPVTSSPPPARSGGERLYGKPAPLPLAPGEGHVPAAAARTTRWARCADPPPAPGCLPLRQPGLLPPAPHQPLPPQTGRESPPACRDKDRRPPAALGRAAAAARPPRRPVPPGSGAPHTSPPAGTAAPPAPNATALLRPRELGAARPRPAAPGHTACSAGPGTYGALSL